MKKDCMFQYATLNEIIENTGLITKDEAEALFEKYQDDIKRKWNKFEKPQMGIWTNCKNNTDYNNKFLSKYIGYEECELKDGIFYKITRQRIK